MKLVLILFAVFISGSAFAEDVPHVRDYAKGVVADLASPALWGRGYTKGGMEKAARYLEREIRRIGLRPLGGKSYRQAFGYPVNTFPGKMRVSLNGKALVPGVDFIVDVASPGGKARGELVAKDDSTFVEPRGRFTVRFADKLTWDVSTKRDATNGITVDRARFSGKPTRFAYEIESRFVPKFAATNLAAFVPGTASPDRYFVFTAHYDHLGGMGTAAYFPGANDNASGVALLLSLARYYAEHPQPYSIAFLFFAGEEAGLLGSKYFVEHPTIDLKQIRFLLNFDIEGTGEAGATVVNAPVFAPEFEVLRKINDEGHYLPQVFPRGKMSKSDHHWFTEAGVPSFYMYTMGGISAYHDVYDRAETLPLNKIDDVFALTLKFGRKIAEEGLRTSR